MEKELFNKIRARFCNEHGKVSKGKMMSSPAIHYNNKVFAFFSTKNKMVFKLGKNYPIKNLKIEVDVFSPFKTKKPLAGWYQLDFKYANEWENLSKLALDLIIKDQMK